MRAGIVERALCPALLFLHMTCFASLALGGATGQRLELSLAQSDVVYTDAERLDLVFRIEPGRVPPAIRMDSARIELTIDADGELATFVPFVLVVLAVEPDGPGGEYRPVPAESARELVLTPGSAQTIRMSATGLIRHWLATQNDLYLRVAAQEPIPSERTADAIRLVNSRGVLAKVVIVAH